MRLLLDTHIWLWSLLEPERLSPKDGGAEAWIENALASAPLREAPFTHEVALATAGIPLPHRDQADRFLAATARVFGFTLVTADRNLGGSEQFPVLLNP